MKKEIDTTCPECKGEGHTGITNCCTMPFFENTDICQGCRDHADDECENCGGTGHIDESEAELNAELEKGDNYNKAQKENNL